MSRPTKPHRREGSEPAAVEDRAPPTALSRATEPLYRALFGAVLDPTIAIDAWGRVVTASASVEAVFGWRPDELVGRKIDTLMPEPHRSRHDEYLANYRRTGQTNILGRTREFEVVHKDGHNLVCELSVARADMPGSAGPLFIGSFRDISDRKRAEAALEASERRFRAIFDRSYEFIGLLATDGTLLEANQASLDLIGATRDDVVGKKFWETPWWRVSEESRTRLRQAIEEAAQGKFVRFETVHRGRGDDVLAVDFSLNPVLDASGKVALLIPEGRDISDIKRAQRAETAMLRALATIGESAAMLAHEIKNPITAVNVALRAVAHQLGEDHRSVLDDLVGRMQRLESLMRRTLTFTRPIELRLASIDVRTLLEQTVRGLRPDIVKCGTDVGLEIAADMMTFDGDRQLLEEVLTNLLKNALEARGAGGRVLLSAAPGTCNGLMLAVDDDGPGIAEHVRGSLFKPFTTTKVKGTGLGLAFCRKVVEEHGGTIEVKESPLGGARFEIRIPATG